MKRFYIINLFIIFAALLSSCEDLIDINLNDSDPRIVIEADLQDRSTEHRIMVTRTIPFNDSRPNDPVDNAEVHLVAANGAIHSFEYSASANAYVNRTLRLREGSRYSLRVAFGDQIYESTETMPRRVPVDSVGVLRENIFNETFYFATLRFKDPANVANYYKYNISVDGKPMKFSQAYSDKFNDGLNVVHQIGSADDDVTNTSTMVVRRHSITASVFKYWNDIQTTNPGSAAPANPTSNISNNALGYFSLSTVDEFRFDFSDYD